MQSSRQAAERDQAAIAEGLNRLLLWARRVTPVQMSSTSITTLDTLTYAGPLRITELATREGVTQPGMTSLINRLETEGFVERFADPTDGRATLVRITTAGGQQLAQRNAARSASMTRIITQLPQVHQAALAAALDALRAISETTSASEPSNA